MFSNTHIVLINPSHPGNIGSAARAMKTMGLSSLILVDPVSFPDARATALASYAEDILEKAMIVKHLEEATASCGLVIGTSARSRTIPWPLLTPREIASRVVEEKKKHPVAILFGREQTGLTNAELQQCHFHVHIPSNPDYSSLNLAQAVQIISYELHLSTLVENPPTPAMPPPAWDYRLATAAEMDGFYRHLQKTLLGLEVLDPKAPRQLMTRLRRLFGRVRPDTMEVNILRGLLSAIEKKTTSS